MKPQSRIEMIDEHIRLRIESYKGDQRELRDRINDLELKFIVESGGNLITHCDEYSARYLEAVKLDRLGRYDFIITDMAEYPGGEWMIELNDGRSYMVHEDEFGLPEGKYILKHQSFKISHVHPDTGLIRFLYQDYRTHEPRLTREIDLYDLIQEKIDDEEAEKEGEYNFKPEHDQY